MRRHPLSVALLFVAVGAAGCAGISGSAPWREYQVGPLTLRAPGEWRQVSSGEVFELHAPETVRVRDRQQHWGLTVHTVVPPEDTTPAEEARLRATQSDEAPAWRTTAMRAIAAVEAGVVDSQPPEHPVWLRTYYLPTTDSVLVVNVSYPAARWPEVRDELLAPIEESLRLSGTLQ